MLTIRHNNNAGRNVYIQERVIPYERSDARNLGVYGSPSLRNISVEYLGYAHACNALKQVARHPVTETS